MSSHRQVHIYLDRKIAYRYDISVISFRFANIKLKVNTEILEIVLIFNSNFKTQGNPPNKISVMFGQLQGTFKHKPIIGLDYLFYVHVIYPSGSYPISAIIFPKICTSCQGGFSNRKSYWVRAFTAEFLHLHEKSAKLMHT